MLILATDLRDYFAEHGIWPEGSTLPMRPMLIVASILVAFLLLRQGWISARRWYVRLHPLRVYFRVAAKAGLSLPDRIWLLHVARQRGLANPLTLMVCDATLTHHVEKLADSATGGTKRRLLLRAEQIRNVLFA